jgi:hypothetical protein
MLSPTKLYLIWYKVGDLVLLCSATEEPEQGGASGTVLWHESPMPVTVQVEVEVELQVAL